MSGTESSPALLERSHSQHINEFTKKEKAEVTRTFKKAVKAGTLEELKAAIDEKHAQWWVPMAKEGGLFHLIFSSIDEDEDVETKTARFEKLNYLADLGGPLRAAALESMDKTPLLHSKVGLSSKSKDGKLPLHHACESGSVEDLQWLYAKETQQAFKGWLKSPSKDGTLPLTAAVASGRLEKVQWIVQHGAGVDFAEADGMQPLHQACKYGRHHLPLEPTARVPTTAYLTRDLSPVHSPLSQYGCV